MLVLSLALSPFASRPDFGYSTSRNVLDLFATDPLSST